MYSKNEKAIKEHIKLEKEVKSKKLVLGDILILMILKLLVNQVWGLWKN